MVGTFMATGLPRSDCGGNWDYVNKLHPIITHLAPLF